MKIYSIIVCLSMFATSVLSQKELTIHSFLNGAVQDETVVFHRQKMRYLSTLPYRLPYIEKLEVRTETNDFDFAKQDYTLRISLNSFRNIKNQNQYQQTVQFLADMEIDEALGEALKKRYDLIVSQIYFKEILKSKKNQKILLTDKVTLLERSIALPKFDVLELIEAQNSVQKIIRDILDLENTILNNQKNISKLNGSDQPVQIEKNELLPIDSLKKFLLNQSASKLPVHAQLSVQSANLYNTMIEYEWEVAKNKFSIGYLQTSYGYDPQDNFRKNFSIGIGVDIPLKGAGQLKQNSILINKLAAESQYRKTKDELAEKQYSYFQLLQSTIQKYELVQKQLEEGKAEFVLGEYLKIAEASPKALLKLRENTLQGRLLYLELEFEIMQTYIAYLDITGLLSHQPLRNYLSKDFTLF